MKRCVVRSIIDDATVPYLTEFIRLVISLINSKKNVNELRIYGTITNRSSNYCACKISIVKNYAITVSDYCDISSSHMSFDELLGNCSTISFHHFSNVTSNYYKGLFDTVEETELFIKAMKYFATYALNYSNLFFSISQESDSGLRYYCEKNCTEIYQLENKRNHHRITYYCEKL